ncbi:MAG: hypothetical protein LZF63_07150 [Nitrosomonas sp.]|nr:hypothetical protein [Nitrosomonas sp.]
MKKTMKIKLAACAASILLTTGVQAHMYTQFPAYDRGGLYEESKKSEWPYYQDGAFGPVRFNIQHACSHAEGAPVSTKQVTIVIPTGTTVKKVNTTLPGPWEFPNFDPAYQELGPASPDANGYDWAIKFVKPYTQASLNRVYPIVDSSGSETPRALVWVGDHPNSNDADLMATMWFPEIPAESCVKEAQYFFPSAQFCSTPRQPNTVTGWLLGITDQWVKENLGESQVQWALTVSMLRDLKTKPLPSSCGNGEVIGIYPSREDIDQYLRPVFVDKKGQNVKQKGIDWWIKRHNDH